MFYLIASKFPIIARDTSKYKFLKILVIGSLCYIVVHAFLFSKQSDQFELIKQYRSYLYYLIGLDLLATYLMNRPQNNEQIKDNEENEDNENNEDNEENDYERSMRLQNATLQKQLQLQIQQEHERREKELFVKKNKESSDNSKKQEKQESQKSDKKESVSSNRKQATPVKKSSKTNKHEKTVSSSESKSRSRSRSKSKSELESESESESEDMTESPPRYKACVNKN